jgi:hypothetical protein
VQPRATDFSSQQQKKKFVPAGRGAQQNNVRGNFNRNSGNRNSGNRNSSNNNSGNSNFGNRNRRFNGGGNASQFRRAGNPAQVQKFSGGGGGARFIHGPGRIVPYQRANFPMVRLGSHVAPLWKGGQKKLYWRGKWRTFVPLAALGAVAIGGAYYYADGYLTTARPYCQGVTPEGCRLNWQRVDFEEGDGDWQCVQYCQRPGTPPPARTVALVAPPPVAQGSCEVAIFSEPAFRGTNATSTDEQPHLSELGWRDQIASIKIASGTWDFFNGEDFTGDVVRFGPGEYPDLPPEWSRKAGSFMCVQP